MKKIIKILSLALALLLVTASFAACGDDTSKDTGKGTVDTSDGNVEYNDDPYKDNVPDMDYGGATISIYASGKDTVKDEFYSEGITTSSIESAVFMRNEAVKDRLKVDFNVILESDADASAINNKLGIAVQAGDTSYDIVVAPTYIAAKFPVQGQYRNLKNCDYIDLDKLYWSQGFNEAFSYGTDKQYLATGEAVISIYRFLYCTIYNKQMFADNHQDDLYGVVNDGKWTLEYQTQLSKKFYQDTGDAATSVYGVAAGDQISIDPYWVSLQCPVVVKDANNHFALAIDDKTAMTKISDSVEIILDLYNDASCYVHPFAEDGFTSNNGSRTIQTFYEERAAMATTVIYSMERHMEFLADKSYGIVPMPKFDEDQDGYYSNLQDQVSAIGISMTVSDDRLQMVGAAVELLASESKSTVVEAYYEKALNYRYLQDPESQQMLKIIYEGSNMTMASVYTGAIYNGFTTFMRNIIGSRANIVSSQFRGIKGQLKEGVDKLNADFEAVDE